MDYLDREGRLELARSVLGAAPRTRVLMEDESLVGSLANISEFLGEIEPRRSGIIEPRGGGVNRGKLEAFLGEQHAEEWQAFNTRAEELGLKPISRNAMLSRITLATISRSANYGEFRTRLSSEAIVVQGSRGWTNENAPQNQGRTIPRR